MTIISFWTAVLFFILTGIAASFYLHKAVVWVLVTSMLCSSAIFLAGVSMWMWEVMP